MHQSLSLRWLILGTLIWYVSLAHAQEKGRPFITNYSYQDYGQGPVNWWAVQGDNGLLYFANNNGVLIYDGSSWEIVPPPEGEINETRAVVKGPDGKIYVAGIGVFGYLEPDEKGSLQYISMKDKLPTDFPNFENVWEAGVYRDEVFFRTNESLFFWNGDSLRIIDSRENALHVGAVVNDDFYQRIWGIGLTRLEGDEFVLVPGGEQFANERIYVMLPYDNEGRILIGARTQGFFIYDGQTFTPFKTEGDPFLVNTSLYYGIRLSNGTFAISTFNDGMCIIDKDGKLLQRFDKSSGLQDNSVCQIYEDAQGNLWLPLFNGISKVSYGSPFTFYSEDSGLPAKTTYSVVRHEGIIYVGTNNGVYYLDPADNTFKRVEGSFGQTRALEVVGGELMFASRGQGAIGIRNRKAYPIRPSVNYDYQVEYYVKSEWDTSLVYAVLFDGLSVLRQTGQGQPSGIVEDSDIRDITITFNGFEEDENGDIWISEGYAGEIKRIRPKIIDGKVDLEQSEMQIFGPEDGLPEQGINLMKIDQGIRFVHDEGMLKFDQATQKFVETDNDLFERINQMFDPNSVAGFNPIKDDLGRYWSNAGTGVFTIDKNSEGIYNINSRAFKEINKYPSWFAYPEKVSEEKSLVWFTGPEGITRFEGSLEELGNTPFSTLIRNVSIGHDSLLYGGVGQAGSQRIAYDQKRIQFSYGAPFFRVEDALEYSTYLEGFDSDWTIWSDQSQKEYLNLSEGKYIFKVKARNVYGDESSEASYTFSIAPPWYRSWWAILLYLALGAALIYMIVRWRTRQLHEQRQQLEEEVQRRTVDLQQRNEELSIVNEVTKAMSGQLNYNELIQMVGNQMQELFQANIVFVAILDKATQMIHFPFGYGDDLPPIKLGQGLTSQIIESGKPQILNKDVDSAYEKYGIERLGKEAASFLGVPIQSGQEVIGVLSVQSTEMTNRFNEKDLNLLSTIASHVGIAIHNAELFEETNAAKAAAEEANEAKGAFLSTVSHELRTPLTSVLGFAKIIKKRLNDRVFPILPSDDTKLQKTVGQVSENLDVVVSEGERLTKLVNDVLDLAKIEAGKVEWKMEEVAIQPIVDRAISSTASLFDQKGLKLEKELDGSIPPFTGDEDKLIQVVVNLLSNAVKFTEKGGVKCKTWQEGNEILVSVSDTGIGIPPEDLESVFEKFKQVGDTLTDKPQGTGLGLPICKEIIEYHQGRIWVESELGKGSTFFFAVPISQELGALTNAIRLDDLVSKLQKRFAATHPANGHDRTILVVDDDSPIRSLLNQELSEVGYKVQEAGNGREALEMVRRHKPDLILLDVMMPEMNGFDVAAVLKNDPETMEIPIIILSIIRDQDRGYKIGVDRYMTKPIDTENLILEIEHLLDQGKSTRKVMVVDEEDSAAKMLIEVLQGRGFQVVESNGVEVVEKAIEARPDVIIMNALLEGHDQMVKALRFEKGLENVLVLVYQ